MTTGAYQAKSLFTRMITRVQNCLKFSNRGQVTRLALPPVEHTGHLKTALDFSRAIVSFGASCPLLSESEVTWPLLWAVVKSCSCTWQKIRRFSRVGQLKIKCVHIKDEFVPKKSYTKRRNSFVFI